MYAEEIQLQFPFRQKALEEFLHEHDLLREPTDISFGVYNDAGELVGTGSRAGNVLKMFAVRADCAGTGIVEMIIGALLDNARRMNIERLFVYTKAGLSNMFGAFGFSLLAATPTTALLFKGAKSPEDYLRELDFPDAPGSVGAVVINANPFTNGHKYLIEKALEHVDRLLVFLVSTDRSVFPYADRLNMLKLGLGENERVIINPSTDFLISAATFPSYFLKEEKLIAREQAMLDALVFRDYFVPVFGIECRFLGSEPKDVSTAVYNEVLKEILSDTIQVNIVERLLTGDEVVSASSVRKILNGPNPEDVFRFVSQPVGKYLLERFLC